jgi:hypothetical protein
MFAEMDTPLDEVLWDMLSAVALGNRIAEQVYAIQPFGGTLLLMLIALRVKPRQALAFVVDPFLRVQGLLAQLPGKPSPVSQGSIVNPALLPNILPRGKFAVLSFRPKNGDPRGTSVLRPAYTAWNLKGQAQIEHLKYLVQFASPSLIGTTPQNATRTPVLDSAGNIVPGKTIDPIENLKRRCWPSATAARSPAPTARSSRSCSAAATARPSCTRSIATTRTSRWRSWGRRSPRARGSTTAAPPRPSTRTSSTRWCARPSARSSGC